MVRTKKVKVKGTKVRRVKPFKLIHLNTFGINNKIDEIEILMQDKKPSIFCVTEHHLNNDQAKLIKIPGYSVGNMFCRKTKNKGGAGIFIKDNIHFKPIDVTSFCMEGDIELTAVEIDDSNLNVMTVYRPPSGNFSTFTRYFHDALKKLSTKEDKVILVCGDFNVNLNETLDCHQKRLKTDFLKLIKQFNLECTVKEDTRVTERSSTLIDNILIDVNRVKAKTKVFETGLSDHKAQEIVFKEFYIKTKKIKSYLLQRVYNKKNTETLK